MDNAHVQEYDNLWAHTLTHEMHERTVGYWFTITAGAVAHTAFRTREELDRWLGERGLTLATDLPAAGEDGGTAKVVGRYRTNMDRDVARFDALEPIIYTTVTDNGEHTPAKITEENGVRTVHFVNVNYRTW